MDLSVIMDTVGMADMEDTEDTVGVTDQWDSQVEPPKYQTKSTLSNWARSMIQTESFSGKKYSKD